MNNQPSLIPADFVVLRVPTLAFGALGDIRSALSDNGCLEDLRQRLGGQMEEAILLASPRLHAAVFEDREPTSAAKLSLARYLFRMATRCTPFGAFAAVGIVDVGEATCLEIGTPRDSIRSLRIDQGVITAVHASLFRAEISLEFLRNCDIRLNSSLWLAPDGWRYVEAKRRDDWNYYELARVENTPAIAALVESLRSGIGSFDQITKELASQFERNDADEIGRLVLRLVQEQFLMAGPQLSVTGADPVRTYIRELEKLGETAITTAMARAQDVVDAVNQSRKPIPTEIYRSIDACFENMPIEIDRARLVQADLQLAGERPQIARAVVEQICESLTELSPLLSRNSYSLFDFASRFEARYGSRSVPLLEALDEDFGVGFGRGGKISTPLIKGLYGRNASEQRIGFGLFDIFCLGRTLDAAKNDIHEIEISRGDLDKFDGHKGLPSNSAVLGSLYAMPDGQFCFELSGVFGPPAGVLLGRFASGSSELAELIKSHQDAAVHEDSAIVAEVVHLPQGRVGNVVIRPTLSAYEIGYLGGSGLPRDKVLQPSDIDVRCLNGHVEILHRPTGRRILPRMSNAHNFDNPLNLPIYRFLGALARQGEAAVGWTWGSVASALPWTPSVRYKNIRLTRERWTLLPLEVEKLRKEGEKVLDSILESRSIPMGLRVVEADNFLQLDLTQSLDRSLFLDACRRSPTVQIERAPSGEPCVRDSCGSHYQCELAIPTKCSETPQNKKPHAEPGRRNWAPGSDWLYARLFCGPSTADQFLRDHFVELSDFAQARGCGRPFFIRYPEGGSHIRIRLAGPSTVLWTEVRAKLEQLTEPFLTSRAVSALEYATYMPEYDRYDGIHGVEVCEAIFAADSLATAKSLTPIYASADRESLRWKYALQSMYRLAISCCQDSETALKVMEDLRDGYLSEFSLKKHDVDPLVRNHKAAIEALLFAGVGPFNELLFARDAIVKEKVESYTVLTGGMGLSAGSVHGILHMCANRVLPENARLHELVLLHMASKSLRSWIARIRSAQKFEQESRLLAEVS